MEAAVRRATYGEDIGQSSWMTAEEWLRSADRLGIGPASRVLEVGSGSGGPAVYLALMRGCRVTGVDINPRGIHNAERLAAARHVADRVAFQPVDAGTPLPFEESAFDAIVSNDAMCHIPNRLDVLRDWHRLLRPGGRISFTDAMVVTGLISHEDLATRSSIGRYVFLPPKENERLLAEAGFLVLDAEDLTPAAASIAARWHAARAEHHAALVEREGADNFEGLQRFLACVQRLSEERRLSRYCYLAEKPA
ncbi:MAG TPA: methyltransferase domain-containing protein [Vicinamibacterales bacterium]|nr:methyltransferase domain-containing protein [Vicinamibacterales bacterium]